MDDLYREQILEHYKRPHNFGRLEDADLDFEDTNPFCGDEQHVFIKLDDDGRVSEVSFEGKGCAISTAATSMLTDELEGMSREELLRLPKEFVLDLLGHRHLGDAHEVRAARAQDRQERQPRISRRTGRTRDGGATPPRRAPPVSERSQAP